MFLALLRAHFNPRYARAKMILSRAKNIFMPANVTSIVISFASPAFSWDQLDRKDFLSTGCFSRAKCDPQQLTFLRCYCCSSIQQTLVYSALCVSKYRPISFSPNLRSYFIANQVTTIGTVLGELHTKCKHAPDSIF